MGKTKLCGTIKGDFKKLEKCEFIKWCRKFPGKVSEPQWFGLICNLAPLQGGTELIHEMSRLDGNRYEYQNTQRLIERVVDKGYRPVRCERLVSEGIKGNDYGGFVCSQMEYCPARAPMYLAALRIVYHS